MMQSHWVQAFVPYVIASLLGGVGPLSYVLCLTLYRNAKLGLCLLSALLLLADLMTFFAAVVIILACVSAGWFAAFVKCQFEKSNDMFPAYCWVFISTLNLWIWGTVAVGSYILSSPTISDHWLKPNLAWLLLFAMPSVIPPVTWMYKSNLRNGIEANAEPQGEGK